MPKSRRNRKKNRGKGPSGGSNRARDYQHIRVDGDFDAVRASASTVHQRGSVVELAGADSFAPRNLESDVEAILELGVAISERGDHEEAIALFDDAIARNPDSALAYVVRGDARDADGDPIGALADYDRAIFLDLGFADAYYNRGVTKTNIGDYVGAIADFNTAIDRDPNSADAYAMRGLAKYRKGDHDDAIADCDLAIALNPSSAQPYHNRGLAKSAKGDYEEAIADFDRSIALDDKDDARDYYHRGIAKAECEDYAYAEIVADFDRAIFIDPDSEDVRYNRGVFKWNWSDIDGAIADFDHSYHPDPKPDYALCYYRRATLIAMSSGNIFRNRDEAIAELTASVPDISGDALDEFASTMVDRYDSIIHDFGRALEMNPDFALAYFGRGNVNARAMDFRHAIADFDHAIELDPEYARAYCNRGAAKAVQADYIGAAADFEQAVSLEVDSLLEPDQRRAFYDLKEQTARAAERQVLLSEYDQLLEISEEEKEEQKRRADAAEGEQYQLRAQIEQLTRALTVSERIPEDTSLTLDTTRVQYYSDSQGREPYIEWLTEELGRSEGRRVRDALTQMRRGNFGDHKPLRYALGLFERRLDSGLRIYYARVSPSSILILGGGNKPDQRSDIDTAATRLADWRARHPK